MCSCNQTKTPPGNTPMSLLSSSGNFSKESIQTVIDNGNKTQIISVEYVGLNTSPFSITSRMDRNITYRFANNDLHRVKTVFLGDAEYLVGLGNYRIVGISVPQDFLNPIDFIGSPIEA